MEWYETFLMKFRSLEQNIQRNKSQNIYTNDSFKVSKTQIFLCVFNVWPRPLYSLTRFIDFNLSCETVDLWAVNRTLYAFLQHITEEREREERKNRNKITQLQRIIKLKDFDLQSIRFASEIWRIMWFNGNVNAQQC